MPFERAKDLSIPPTFFPICMGRPPPPLQKKKQMPRKRGYESEGVGGYGKPRHFESSRLEDFGLGVKSRRYFRGWEGDGMIGCES